MPIKGLTDRPAQFPEIGQIRKGAPKPEDGKRPGADLRWFRVTFDDEELETSATFLKHYGDQPAEIDILLPFNAPAENFEAWKEAYVAGGLTHRCDGDKVWYELDAQGQRSVVAGVPEKVCDGSRQCKPVGRLKVIVPQLQRLAFLTVLTSSIHDIMNLQRQLDALSQINGKLAGIPLKLRRRPVMISTPSGSDGKRARREKWLLSIEADPAWVKAKLLAMRAAALPGNGLGEEMPLLEAPDEADESEEGEWTQAAFKAGEDEASEAGAQKSSPKADRPYPPEILKAKMAERVIANEGKPADKKMMGLMMGSLEMCFAGEDKTLEKRHSVLAYLFGVLSGLELAPAQVLALREWLKPKPDSGGQWFPDEMAEREAQAVLQARMAELGQEALFAK